ncbi:MAG TPA: PQQ-binding-like beta-propeller repeat protein [Acidimicrobiales bacterium]|nr:PQQ-binding-like beta-propeller repeat protein [Acidimicrobiales bacterium]
MTNARRLATRIILSSVSVAGICIFGGALTATRAGAANDLTLTETWTSAGSTNGVVLDDAPCGVAEASPVEFNDGGTPAVEVGDRQGFVYGLNLQTGAVAPGWGGGTENGVGSGQGCDSSPSGTGSPAMGAIGVEVPGSPPIDSTSSVGPNGNLYFGGGNAAAPIDGGYYAYGPNGSEIWNQVVTNPSSDTVPNGGVQASPSLADGGSLVEAGSLGQETYALNTGNGSPAAGWPQFSADSVFSTAAVGDLYNTGSDEFISGGASSQGFAFGKHYSDGGHLRIYNDHGGLICSADTTEEIDSSPAVGPILAGGHYGIATGTGSFFGGSDENTVKVFDSKCNQVWSVKLNGTTGGSPALADITGNGQLSVVEGTVTSSTTGSVYALNAQTGGVLWQANLPGAVYGSVTTANFGSGYQDVIVPTDLGLFILDGQSGQEVAHVDDGSGNDGVTGTYGFQNAALVTADQNGSIGITVAGYFGVQNTNYVQGIVQHFEVQGSNGAVADEAGGWPQFHHDAGLSGFDQGTAPLGQCDRPTGAQHGYLTVASDGGIFAFGQDFCGSTGSLVLNKPVVGMAAVPGQGGYWLVASDGGIFSYGDAGFYGSTGSLHLNAPVVGMAPTPDGKGYWLVASDGGIFSFGDAGFYGSVAGTPGQDIVGMAATPDGLGYWEVSTTGHVFTFGDAQFAGDTEGVHLNAPISGITPDPVTGGYWLVGTDGGVFSFGAPFFGSTGNIRLNQPVVAMQSTLDGGGYWFVASDGGIFAYGDAPFQGSMGGRPLNRPMVGMDGF